MASTRFTVLTGHLSQYSLADLIGILRHQRKTGRLLIEYIGCPAILFFKDGELVDAQYNTLIGVQAIFVAFVQPPASFNFNPLIQPTRCSIDSEQQRVILELLGCWSEDSTVVRVSTQSSEATPDEPTVPELQNSDTPLLLAPSSWDKSIAIEEADEMLALPAGPPRRSARVSSRRRRVLLAVATFVLLLVFGVPTLIAINNKVRKPSSSPTTPTPDKVAAEQTAKPSDAGDSSQITAQVGAVTPSSPVERKRDPQPVISNETRSDAGPKELATPSAQPTGVSKTGLGTESISQGEKAKQPSTSGQTVRVIMRIENGRVVQASVGDRRPGSEAYESLALRIARQRRYPSGVNKQETLIMKVDGPK